MFIISHVRICPTDSTPARLLFTVLSERDSDLFRCGLDEGGVPALGEGVRTDGIHLCRDPGDRGVLLQTRCEKKQQKANKKTRRDFVSCGSIQAGSTCFINPNLLKVASAPRFRDMGPEFLHTCVVSAAVNP